MKRSDRTTLQRLGGRLRRLESRPRADEHFLSRRAIDDIGSVRPFIN